MRTNGMAEQIDVVVVGAGQAGLAVSYYLQAFGVEHAVLERGRIGESWRSARWDSFTLVTPNWMTRLPSYRMAAGTGGDFPPRDDVVAVLGQFAAGLPVRERGSHRAPLRSWSGGFRSRRSPTASGPTPVPPAGTPPESPRCCAARTGRPAAHLPRPIPSS